MMENCQVRFGGGPMEKCPNRQLASGLPYRLNVEGNKPYTVRITQQWADAGMPSCPCGTLMVLDSASDEALREAA
jgi:hypothetical protein